MYQPYMDIIERLGRPLWWDENGVPRHVPFAPHLCADIYADMAALLVISCQGCNERIEVSSTWSKMKVITEAIARKEAIDTRVRYDDSGRSTPISMPAPGDPSPFGYGDAPWHGYNGDMKCQCAGTTMTTSVAAIIEFWERHSGEWQRNRAYEMYIGE